MAYHLDVFLLLKLQRCKVPQQEVLTDIQGLILFRRQISLYETIFIHYVVQLKKQERCLLCKQLELRG